MSNWSIVALQRSLGAHYDAWGALNDQRFGSHPMLSSLFVEGLLRNFGDGTEHLCVLQGGGETQAMCIIKRSGPLLWTSFLPAQAQIGTTMIADASLPGLLLDTLPLPALELDLLCNDPKVGGVVIDSSPPTFRLNHALTIAIALEGSFADYWAARSKKLQSNINRYLQRIQATGLAWRLDIIENPAAISDAVDRYAAQEASGWKGKAGTSLSSDPAQLSFYKELMLGEAYRRGARVFELWFGDTMVASRLALVNKGQLVMLKTSYLETWAHYSPGRILLKMVIEHAFGAWPAGRIEFYTDANQDQLQWATEHRWIQHSTYLRWPSVQIVLAGKRVIRQEGKEQKNPIGQEPSVAVFRDLNELPSDALALLARHEKRNLELGSSWFRNLIDTVYTTDPFVRFYVLKHKGEAVAVVPLRVEEGRWGKHAKSLSNYYTSLYEPALAPGLKSLELAVLVSAIRRDFRHLASFSLSPMDPASHAYQTLLGAFRLRAWLPFEYFSFGNWFLSVDTDWKGYLATRPSGLRSTIKRMSKKFTAEGGTLQVVTKASELPAAIAAYEQVYAKSWKQPEPYLGFVPGLLNTFAAKGCLRLGLAWLNGEPIAAQIWLVANGRAEIYKVAYNEAFKPYSPGTLISAMLMEYVIEQDKVREVDYLIGDDPYKKTWMSHRRERWGIVAYNPRTIAGLVGATHELMARFVKQQVNWMKARFLKRHSSEIGG
jgi:CelD/BcsL family acetyltransferase involved in cellulose biosynthesis